MVLSICPPPFPDPPGQAGVYFIKVGRKAQIIEIALSICTLRLPPTFWEAFYWLKIWARGPMVQKQFMKSVPELLLLSYLYNRKQIIV